MLRKIEKAIRTFRDERIIRPLVLSKNGRRYYEYNFDAVVRDMGTYRLAFDPKDEFIGAQIMSEGGWFLPETLNVFSAIPRRGDVFVDVGANIGTQTIYALKLGHFQRAVCFEPDPWNIQLLRANILFNDLADRVTVIEAAAGAKRGTAMLSKDATNLGAHSLVYDRGSSAKVEVPLVTIEEALNDLGIRPDDLGLVWIDVEGFEGDVLEGWPSLGGIPLCIEYSPEMKTLPADTFNAWQHWADARSPEIVWRPISELDLPSYTSQQDLLLK